MEGRHRQGMTSEKKGCLEEDIFTESAHFKSAAGGRSTCLKRGKLAVNCYNPAVNMFVSWGRKGLAKRITMSKKNLILNEVKICLKIFSDINVQHFLSICNNGP